MGRQLYMVHLLPCFRVSVFPLRFYYNTHVVLRTFLYFGLYVRYPYHSRQLPIAPACWNQNTSALSCTLLNTFIIPYYSVLCTFNFYLSGTYSEHWIKITAFSPSQSTSSCIEVEPRPTSEPTTTMMVGESPPPYSQLLRMSAFGTFRSHTIPEHNAEVEH